MLWKLKESSNVVLKGSWFATDQTYKIWNDQCASKMHYMRRNFDLTGWRFLVTLKLYCSCSINDYMCFLNVITHIQLECWGQSFSKRCLYICWWYTQEMTYSGKNDMSGVSGSALNRYKTFAYIFGKVSAMTISSRKSNLKPNFDRPPKPEFWS